MSTHRTAPASRTLAAGALALATLIGYAPTASADAVRDKQWYLDQLHITRAHHTSQGQGVKVAVIDDTTRPRHPDLAGNVLPGKTFDPTNTEEGHGVAVASLIAGHGHGHGGNAGILGVAPKAKILPLQAQTGSIGQAIRWAVDHGATVINLSQSAPSGPLLLKPAVRYAQVHNVVVVAAAGNASEGEEVEHPAAYPGIIATSATNSSGAFSSVSVSGKKVDLAAPGENIISATPGGGYEVADGTSFSAPIVAGTAALIRARYPDMNAASVINRLITTATDKGPSGDDPKYGHGVVNPVKALTADVPNVTTNPLGSLAPANNNGRNNSSQPSTQPQAGGNDGSNGGDSSMLLFTLLAMAGVAVIAVGAGLLAWLSSRRRKKPATVGPPGPPGPPGAPPPHGPGTGPYGPPPGQQPPQNYPPQGPPPRR